MKKYLLTAIMLPYVLLGANFSPPPPPIWKQRGITKEQFRAEQQEKFELEHKRRTEKLAEIKRLFKDVPLSVVPNNKLLSDEYTTRQYFQQSQTAVRNQIKGAFCVGLNLIATKEEVTCARLVTLQEEQNAFGVLMQTAEQQKTEILDTLSKIPMVNIALADGTTISVRRPILEEMSYFKAILSGNFKTDHDKNGAIVFADDAGIDPTAFRKFIDHQTEKYSGVRLKNPIILFAADGVAGTSLEYSPLIKNAPMLRVVEYLAPELLETCEDWIQPQGHRKHSRIFTTVHELQIIANLPDCVLEKYMFTFDIQNPTLIYADNFEEHFMQLVSKTKSVVPSIYVTTKDSCYRSGTNYESSTIVTIHNNPLDLLKLNTMPECVRTFLQKKVSSAPTPQ